VASDQKIKGTTQNIFKISVDGFTQRNENKETDPELTDKKLSKQTLRINDLAYDQGSVLYNTTNLFKFN